MKTLAAFAILTIGLVRVCQADVTDKLIGTWSGTGTGTATSNGEIVTQKIFTVYKRYERSGLQAVTTITGSGQKFIGTSRFYRNGKVEGELKLNGSVVAVISGTWTVTSNALKSNVKAEGVFPSFQSNSKVTLVSPRKITISGRSSTGERSIGSLRRQ